MSNLIPTADNKHPLLKMEKDERKKFVMQSILLTVTMTVVLYIFPSYYGLEKLTTNSSYFLLDLFSFKPRVYTYEDNLNALGIVDKFLYALYDPSRATYPAISIDIGNTRRMNYLIVRACTGMQAGALLLGLIWSTPAETQDRIRASYVMLIALFVGNVARIAAMIAMTTIMVGDFKINYEDAWYLAHDVMGRPLGFFGTIGFTMLIEKRNVRILDTIQAWMDFLMNTKPKVEN